MTHDKISKFRIYRAYKFGADTFKEKHLHRKSHISAYRTIWSVQAAGVQVYSRSPENKKEVTSSGTERSIYSETANKSDYPYKGIWEIYWRIFKQHRYTSLGVISQKKGAWLRGIHKDKSRCIITSIDFFHKRYPRPIGYWFPKRFGLLIRSQSN